MIQELSSIAGIVGGEPVEAGRFGFQAAVLENGSQLGGGSLIAPNVVLTGDFSPFGTPTEVALGCVDINDLTKCEVIEIVETIITPELEIEGFSGQAMLLILNDESIHTPVSLAASGFDLQAGQDLTVIGRGIVDPATLEDSGGVLLETIVEASSQESCVSQYRDILGLFFGGDYYSEDTENSTDVDNSNVDPLDGAVIGDGLFCAGAEQNGPCGFGLGDFGAPIFLRCDASGDDVQVGFFVPFFGCVNDGVPVVYLSIFETNTFAFIQSIVQSQGHVLKTVERTSDFCVVGGTQPEEELTDPPTPFPTFDLKAWTCLGQLFADGQQCNCNCGIPDPDCEFNNENAVGCEDGEVCANAICITSEDISLSPTTSPTTTPTTTPTTSPTTTPTSTPTTTPTTSPTTTPTTSPTTTPTKVPTQSPSVSPSAAFLSRANPFILIATMMVIAQMI